MPLPPSFISLQPKLTFPRLCNEVASCSGWGGFGAVLDGEFGAGASSGELSIGALGWEDGRLEGMGY